MWLVTAILNSAALNNVLHHHRTYYWAVQLLTLTMLSSWFPIFPSAIWSFNYYKNKILKYFKNWHILKDTRVPTFQIWHLYLCFWFIWEIKGSITALWRNVTIFKLVCVLLCIHHISLYNKQYTNHFKLSSFSISCSFYLLPFRSLLLSIEIIKFLSLHFSFVKKKNVDCHSSSIEIKPLRLPTDKSAWGEFRMEKNRKHSVLWIWPLDS